MIFKFGETLSVGTRNELGVQREGVPIKGEEDGWSLRETCYLGDRQKKGRNNGYRPSEEPRIFGMVAYACNPNASKVKEGGSRILG